MHRRNILKVAGAASALPFVTGSAAAASQDDNGDDDDGDNGDGQGQSGCSRPNCIHPTLGYSGLSPDEDLPSALQPDHEVDLVTEPRADAPLPEFYFEPTGLHVSQGDVVRFNLVTPDHTVTAYHPGLGRQRRVPEGVPPFSSPVLAGETFWLYRFDETGVYDMLCAPHEIFGMVGRVVVGEASAEWMDDDDDDTEHTSDDAGETNNDDGDDNDDGVDDTGGDDDDDSGMTETRTSTEPSTSGEASGVSPELRPPELTAALVFADPALEIGNIQDQGQVSWDDLADESKEILVELPQEGPE